MVGQGLKISKALHGEMIERCKKEHPKEACGILAGRDGAVEAIYPMTNIEHSAISYQMDPKEQLILSKKMRVSNQKMLAIYHSHTASGAYPSSVDVDLAVYPEVSCVVISLQNKAQPDVQSYRIADGKISRDNLQIEG